MDEKINNKIDCQVNFQHTNLLATTFSNEMVNKSMVLHERENYVSACVKKTVAKKYFTSHPLAEKRVTGRV